MFVWIILAILIISALLLIKNKIIIRDVVIEGIIIGVLSGIVISYITNGDFRANAHSPIIKLGKLLNFKVRYISKNWTNIKVKEAEKGIYDVDATNIATGSIVKFEKKPISALPPDLGYDIATSDVVQNRVFFNIQKEEQSIKK